MKLRIKGNSIRLRLVRTEVAALLASGVVEEETWVGDEQRFCYRLTSKPAAAKVTASFGAGALEVAVPAGLAERWGRSEQVEIRVNHPGKRGDLSILIEKDYPCLTDRVGEDDSDAFSRDKPAL